jgi:hypothetical protein
MKRMPGTGSIYQRDRVRPDGTPYTRWVAQVSRGPRGKRRIHRRIFATREAAEAAINDQRMFITTRKRITAPIARRFYSHVEREGHPDGCWEWTGYIYPSGYGNFAPGKGETAFAHRFALSMEMGRPLAVAEWALHKCSNRACVRVDPQHVYLGDAKQNSADRWETERKRKAA